MKKLIWTASVALGDGIIIAQCKASKKELLQRIKADDPCWNNPRGPVRLGRQKMLDKSKFRRGLAFHYQTSQ